MLTRTLRLPILAVLSALLLAACGGGSPSHSTTTSGVVGGHTVVGLYGSLPSAGTPTSGGTITMGQLTGDTPTWILPLIPSANGTDGTAFLVDQLYIPLYNIQVGGDFKINYATSGALPPTFSDGDRRVTIRLRPNFRWSNGRPVSAQDVLFDLAILRAAVKEGADNDELFTPGLLPENIRSAAAPNPRTVVLTFDRPYNPNFILGDQLADLLVPLPSAEWDIDRAGGPALDWHRPAVAKQIYGYLAKQGGTLGTLGSNPLWKTVDGPFTLSSFSTTNGSFTLLANPRYSLTGPVRFHELSVQTFTSTTAQLDALQAGGLEVAAIDFSQLHQATGLRQNGFAVYGYPNIGTFGEIINFHDRTDHFNDIVAQLYARQALAHLQDQPGYITGALKGAGAPAYGPLPTIPRTPFTPADAGTNPYPFSVASAAALLKAHGWKVVPGGQTTCVKPGSGTDECGAGIPAGTPFKFTLAATPASNSPAIPLESEALASSAKQVGIEIAITSKTFNYQISNYDDSVPADRHNEGDWGLANWGEYGTTAYPTEQVGFASNGTQNFGGYSSATADRLIDAAEYSPRRTAATQVADYLAKQLPVLFLPCADVLDAVSDKVGGTNDSFLAMTQDVFYPQYWYLKKT